MSEKKTSKKRAAPKKPETRKPSRRAVRPVDPDIPSGLEARVLDLEASVASTAKLMGDFLAAAKQSEAERVATFREKLHRSGKEVQERLDRQYREKRAHDWGEMAEQRERVDKLDEAFGALARLHESRLTALSLAAPPVGTSARLEAVERHVGKHLERIKKLEARGASGLFARLRAWITQGEPVQ